MALTRNFQNIAQQRPQIDTEVAQALPDDAALPRGMRVGISELIRETLAKDNQKDPESDAQAFFDKLKPLESFAQTDSQAYVRGIRNTSRILMQDDEHAA